MADAVMPYERGAPVLVPWVCEHKAGQSDVNAYIAANGSWQTIAEVKDAKGIDPEAIAELIARAVNAYHPTQDLIRQLTATLELCLTCDLSWEAENEVDIMLRRIKSAY